MIASHFLDAPQISIIRYSRFEPFADIKVKEFHYKIYIILLSDIADTMETLAEKKYFNGKETMKHFQKVAQKARKDTQELFGTAPSTYDWEIANQPFNRMASACLSQYAKKLDPYLEEILATLFKMDYLECFTANMFHITGKNLQPFAEYIKIMTEIFNTIYNKGMNSSFDFKKIYRHTGKIIYMKPKEFYTYSTGEEPPKTKKVTPCKTQNITDYNQIITEIPQMITKACTKCKKKKPATAEFFRRDKSNKKFGLTARCKDCLKEQKKTEKKIKTKPKTKTSIKKIVLANIEKPDERTIAQEALKVAKGQNKPARIIPRGVTGEKLTKLKM